MFGHASGPYLQFFLQPEDSKTILVISSSDYWVINTLSATTGGDCVVTLDTQQQTVLTDGGGSAGKGPVRH